MSDTRTSGDHPLGSTSHKTERSRGQILILFVMAIFVFTGMVALVIDVSWYWVNSLRVQRAADAAALAGVVQLPDNASGAGGAYILARAEARKNGYDDVAPIVVTTVQQPATTGRRLEVTVSAPVPTFFMRIFGINQITATRTAKAEFVLPVPMGSPQQWYGVGTFEKLYPVPGAPVAGPTVDTGWKTQTSFPATVWTRPDRADANANSSYAISPVTNNSAQQWGTFGLTSGGSGIPTGAVIEGIEVRYRALATGSGNATTCRVRTEIAYNNTPTWTTTPVDQTITTGAVTYTMGSASNLTAWPRASGSWAFSSFTDANFRVRLTWNKPNSNCGASRTVSVDTLEVRVTYHPMVPGPVTYVPGPAVPVPTPPGETVAPTSQGFWGAIFTAGGVRRNGDRYSTKWYFTGSSALNTEQILEGYDYIVELGGGNGRVHLFDPIFCATGSNPAGSGNFGAGDHWTDLPASGGISNSPVTTEFTLYDTRGTVEKSDDVVKGSPMLYTSQASDQSGEFGSPPTGGSITDCRANPAHNTWVTPPSWSSLASGKYRVNVKSSQAGNAATGAENLWSLYVGDNGGAGSARVYGEAKMVAYSNLTGATARQEFYLAQIEKEHAGKTMEIRLFDPGDVSGNATLRIKSPDGNVYNYATFSYQADGQCSAGNSDVCSAPSRTSIRTAISGSSSFDNTVITISIPLPATYGNVGLTPAGETEAGWWKIEYEVGAANDTTTWEVSIIGNPVHLIVP